VHIVIMGCGRVGSTLAHILEDRDNSIAIIDRNPEAFRRLRSSFKGERVTGIGFDRAVLIQAGIERADAFAAVSSGDNSNIIAARVAKIVLAEVAFSPVWIGEQVKALEASSLTRIVFLDRLGQAFVPEPGTVLQEGDVIHVVAKESELDRIAAIFASRGGEH